MTKHKEKEEAEVTKKDKITKRLFEISAKAVILKNSKVLILKRTGGGIRDAGKSDLPGGAVEAGEEINSSLSREIKEELGIIVEIGPVIYLSDYKKEYFLDEEKKEKVEISGKGIGLLAYYQEGDIKLSDEHEKYKWLDIKEAIEKFSEKDEFEHGKKETLKKAQQYIEMVNALDGWKRCLADFENFRKQQEVRQAEFRKFAAADLIAQILPILDNFHASTGHIPDDQKENPWVVGIMHIQKQLEGVLKDNGVEEIMTKIGDQFDHNIHEAVANQEGQETNDKRDKNKIIKVASKGYKIGDKVIRPARVVVS